MKYIGGGLTSQFNLTEIKNNSSSSGVNFNLTEIKNNSSSSGVNMMQIDFNKFLFFTYLEKVVYLQ